MNSMTLATLEHLDSIGAIARLAHEQCVSIDILIVPQEKHVDVVLSVGDTLEFKARRGATETIVHTYMQ